MTDRRYRVGLMGEQAAEALLTRRGMTVLARRFRYGRGEIDLICEDHGTVVFVEVKARPRSRAGEGLLAVTPDKQRRIADAAAGWLMQNGGFDQPIRFDIVELTADGPLHVPNAFAAGDW